MYYVIRSKTILQAAIAAVLAVTFCIGCYDLGIEPTPHAAPATTFVDVRDGHVYKKVTIGDQTWMAENLNFAAEGSACYVDNGLAGHWEPPQFCDRYGRLYDWNTAMDYVEGSSADPSGVEGVCPVGWHLPSEAEWNKLIHFLEPNAGTKMKSTDFPGNSPGYSAPVGRDTEHFEALAGGLGSLMSTSFFPNLGENPPYFWDAGRTGYWWTSTEYDIDNHKAWLRSLMGASTGVVDLQLDKHYMLSVRCVHD